MPATVVKTIRASGGDYTTITAWEAANQGDLVTADEIRVAECYNDWPAGLGDAFIIAGSTTDATRYLKITVAEGHRHNGTPKTGFFLIGNAAVTFCTLVDAYTVLDGLDVENTNTTSGVAIGHSFGGTGLTVKNTIVRTRGSSGFGLRLPAGSTAINCLAWGNSTAGATGFDVSRARNCTAYGYAAGFGPASGDKSCKNCVAYGASYQDFYNTTALNCSNNASEDATAPGAGSITGITSAAFVNAAGNDFHLAAGSALIGAGVNLYSDFTTDIDGDTWPSGGAWDIGFDYYVSSGTNVSLSGVTGTGAIGSLSQQISPNITLASALATGAIGSFSFTSVPVISLTGTQATGAVGSLSTTASADVTLTGTQATGAIGSLTVNTSGSTSVNLTGVQAASNVGTFTFNVSPNVSLTGVQALGQVGTASVITGMVITPTGVSATGAVGTITTRADVTLTLSSVSASGQVGSVTVGGVGVSVALSGVAASSAVGAITVTTQNTGWTDIALSGGTWTVQGAASSIWTVQGAASSIWTDLTGD